MSKLLLVSGVSGSGKTVIMREIMNNEFVSFTTREPRVGEIHGKDYFFITKEEFQDLHDGGKLVEMTEYSDNYYGLTKQEVNTKLSIGDTFFICDFNGMKQIKKMYPESISIFFYCEKEEVEANMRDRGDSEDNIAKRLRTYDEEITNLIHYDYVVTNKRGNIEEAIQDVKDILEV
ncbi:guanylate kinase [Paenibacillaceae bacterium]|nr:guanylate kinase [Paenibacillaceae bacterium]